jgi:hypothetical protein
MIRVLAIVAAVGWLAAVAGGWLLKRELEANGQLRRMLAEASAKLKEVDHARELRERIDGKTRDLSDDDIFNRLR